MSRGNLIELAHAAVSGCLRPGEWAVDATVGNGHDTLFLAAAVGEAGHVWGFDLQAQALANTGQRLAEAGLDAQVTLLATGHERMAECLPGQRGAIRAVMFNLGYLPGSDKHCTTRPATTRRALDAACDLLMPGGVITVIAYTGHPGGEEEAESVLTWSAALGCEFLVWREVPPRPKAPQLTVVSRL